MRHLLASVLVMSVAAAAGCSAMQRRGDSLRSRASFDMKCPADQLQLTEIDNHTAGVEGCGHRATYIWSNNDGTWVLNSRPDDESR